MGRPDVAIELIERALLGNPSSPDTHNNLGIVLQARGYVEKALIAFRNAIRLKHSYPEAHYNLANGLQATGQIDDAIAEFREAVMLKPDFGAAHYNLGNALQTRGRIDEAVAAYHCVLRIDPSHAEAWRNLGNALHANRDLDGAIDAYRRALELNPEQTGCHGNLAVVLQAKGHIDEALAANYDALRMTPDSPATHTNIASCLKDQGRLDEALEFFRRAIELDPDAADRFSALAYTVCFHPDYDAARILEINRQWDRRYGQPLKPGIIPHENEASPERRLRIGYVSPDFCEHVVGYSMLPVIREHDRRAFDIYCYSNVLRPDGMTTQLASLAGGWRNIVGISDEAAAEMIRADQIDILVDLALHTARNRLPIFARKPAPIQVAYLGYAGTTGMEAMDYRLSDPYFDPPDANLNVYREQTVRLPGSYWLYQPMQSAPASSGSPAAEQGFVTFGCLNKFAKASTAALELWPEILLAVPGSRLLLQGAAGFARQSVHDRFARNGVAAERVEFVGLQPCEKYFETFRRIDIALDPFPYGGGISTCDALWMGVPVVTLNGATAVGRGGRSILSHLGLPELVAETPQEYVSKAVALAHDLPRLRELRATLRDRMEHSPLRDAKRHTQEIEDAYREMWRNWLSARQRA